MITFGLRDMNYFQSRTPPANIIKTLIDKSSNTKSKMLHIPHPHMANVVEVHENSTIKTRLRASKTLTSNDRVLHRTVEEILQDNPMINEVLGVVYAGIAGVDNTNMINNSLKDVQEPFPNTCDWILEEDLYKEWEGQNLAGILFIRGMGGMGKSVLAKFIIKRLQETQPKTVLAYFFCQAVGVQNTPAMILRHIILQINRQQPNLMVLSLLERPIESFTGQFDVNVLWPLFVNMIHQSDKDIYIVVDGVRIQLLPFFYFHGD